VAVSGVTNAVHVDTFYRTTCAALSTGEYRCWGDNGNGHVGDSTYLDRTTPVAVLYLTPADVTCNATPGAAPTSEVCDGDDDNCDGVNDDISYSPCDACTVPSGACTAGVGACARTGTYVCGTAGAVDGALGYQHTCAVLRDGTVRCWGYNGQGQLGNGTTPTRSTR
jgi:hypothetical protein